MRISYVLIINTIAVSRTDQIQGMNQPVDYCLCAINNFYTYKKEYLLKIVGYLL